MDELLTVGEVSKELRVDITTVIRWIKSGAMPAVTLPRTDDCRKTSYRVRKSDVDKILEGVKDVR